MKVGRKRIPNWLLCAFMLPAVAQAQFTFTTNNGAITITGYTGSGGVVLIPSTTNGYLVTSIRDGALQNQDSLTSVIISNGVTNIGQTAFSGCHGLTNITIPSSVTSIGISAFGNCTNLNTITVDAQNPSYCSVNGVLFNKSQTTLVEYSGGLLGCYTIPGSVTNIAESAFVNSTTLTNVTISSSVTSIGNYAFAICTRLTAITVDSQNLSYSSVNGVLFNKSQSTLVEYPGGLFGTYTIPASTTNIAEWAFFNCTGLTGVKIPSSVTSIGNYAFDNCFGLANVTITNGVINIGNYAFFNCTSLPNVTIPSSVTSIGNDAFVDCTSLAAITVDSHNIAYSDVNGVLFSKSQKMLITCPSGLVGSYTIPGSATIIGNSAFAGCTGLTYVTIPDSVTSIWNDAFAYCTSLTYVKIPGSVTSIYDGAFAYCSRLTGVYFEGNSPGVSSPYMFLGDDVTIYYLPGTKGWGPTFGGLNTKLWNPQAQTGDSAFGVRTNRFGFNITGTANIPIVVEAGTNLAGDVWTPLQTCTVTNGSIYFSDPQWTNYPGRFYRLRSP